ncbi:MAG: pilus assembly protein N-terminal domain-containing protein [Planctomycetaceae bacterium]|nr:pilus assembly protein N-terminal domain-containing protein [Planctomycetaceae bacterium]
MASVRQNRFVQRARKPGTVNAVTFGAFLTTALIGLDHCPGQSPSQFPEPQVPPRLSNPEIVTPVIPMVPPRPMGPLSAPEKPKDFANVMDLVGPLSNVDATLELFVGQARTLTLKKPVSEGKSVGVVALGDPSIADFEILPNPRMLRLSGKRAGLTDLTILFGDESILTLQVFVKYDLELLRAEINQRFPDANIKISQLRENIVLEGQVRTGAMASQIMGLAEAWLSRGSVSAARPIGASGGQGADKMQSLEDQAMSDPNPMANDLTREVAGLEVGGGAGSGSQTPKGGVINLLRVPGTQQIMLQVRVAELNRTGMREVGADWIFGSDNGNVVGTNISGNVVTAKGTMGSTSDNGMVNGGLNSAGTGNVLGANGTAFGIFPSANFDVLLRILRKNALLSILAEPNLVAMSGHEASFLAGGQFPVPVVSGLGGQVSIQYKDFGVQLRFTPTILDEDTIRLNVAPEVSTIDETLGTTLVPGGIPTPGINTRKVNTTVEMREGETLALAGLLEVAIDAQTTRIPGLGDLPYLGPFFSNTSQQRVEKELLVLVTPYFVAASPNCEDFVLPGQDIQEPNDLEFYLLGRIEGKTGRSFNTVQSWEDPWNCVDRIKLERQCLHGPVGFSR